MPRKSNKDLKRLVRTHMQKTGESYTAARSRIVKSPALKKPVPVAVDYEALTGKRDAVMVERTGRDWASWVALLDAENAFEKPHGEIARIVKEQFGTADWWTQTVAVGYERIKGLRDINQRRGGTYEASKSKTFGVSVDDLFAACANARVRRKWITDANPAVRSSTAAKSMRLAWDDGSIVVLGFLAKGETKSALAVQHGKLPDRAAVDRVKTEWATRLDALAEYFKGS